MSKLNTNNKLNDQIQTLYKNYNIYTIIYNILEIPVRLLFRLRK